MVYQPTEIPQELLDACNKIPEGLPKAILIVPTPGYNSDWVEDMFLKRRRKLKFIVKENCHAVL